MTGTRAGNRNSVSEMWMALSLRGPPQPQPGARAGHRPLRDEPALGREAVWARIWPGVKARTPHTGVPGFRSHLLTPASC